MRRRPVLLLLFASLPLLAQETQLGAAFRLERETLAADCTDRRELFGCAQTVVTGTPLRLSVGSLAPQNGTGFGPGFSFDKNFGENWRTNTSADAVVTMNQSWRAGIYFKAFYKPKEKIVVLNAPPTSKAEVEPKPVPTFNVYAQGISLNNIDYYGLGPSTSRQSEAVFGLTETIIGGNVVYPIFGSSGLSLFGEMNGRFFDPRGRTGQPAPSLEVRYPTEELAPGLLRQLSYFQAGEGIRFNTSFGARLELDYSVTLRQYQAVTDGHYSFQHFTVDAIHEFPLYRKQRSQAVRSNDKPKFTFNREGSIAFRVLLDESFEPSGHEVPFYLQPTLGGGDLNGENFLGSYPDYRFRAPNLMLFRGSLEHAIWGPVGGMFLADFGRVALTRGDLGFNQFRHSYGVGLTIRGGGIPAVTLLFAFGGGEGTHLLAGVSQALMGGNSRPSLY